MLQRSCRLSVIMAAVCTIAAAPDESEARPNEVPGWGRVIDPWRGLRRLARPRTRAAEDPGARDAPRLEHRSPPAPDERPARRPPRPGRFHGQRPRARSARAGAVQDHALQPLPRRRPDRLAGPVELPPARTGRRVHRRATSSLHQLRVARRRSPGCFARVHDRRSSALPQAPATGRGVLGLVQLRWTPMGRA